MSQIIIADIRSHALTGKITGHFIPLAKNYLELFKDVCNVKVAGGPAYLQCFPRDKMIILPYNVNGTTPKDKIHTFINCRKLFRDGERATIIFQQSSVATLFLAIALFYHRRSELYMIQYSQTGINSWIKKLLYCFAKNKIDGIICPNDEVGKAYGLPYIVVPDYIYTGEADIHVIPFEQKIYDFCIVGRLSTEKGVTQAIKELKTTNFKVLIAGKPQTEMLADEIKQACEGASNIELHLGYIDDQNYLRYIHQSRYSILNYQGEYSIRSSGVVYDMLFNGTPVIGRRCSALKFIEDQGLGLIYDKLNNIDFSRLIDIKLYHQYLQNIIKYRMSHQQYKDVLINFLLG